MRRIINKKGDLLNNILTTVIAVVGLVIIIYATYRLYSVYANQEETKAKNDANIIEARINLINNGESGKVVITGVEGWSLIGWSKNDANRPDKCSFKSCLCVCKYTVGKTPVSPEDKISAVETCQKSGICRFFDFDDVKVSSSFECEIISGSAAGPGASVPVISKTTCLKNAIQLPKNLIELTITKDKEGKIIDIKG